MEARAVVVAAELRNLVIEVGERVRAVDHHVDAPRVRHVDDLAHRKNLAGDVHDVRHHHQPRARRDGAGVELARLRRRTWDRSAARRPC